MGKEVDLSDAGIVVVGGSDDSRVLDWEDGLPSGDDLTPLSMHLLPPELASAFSIAPADIKTMLDVHRASQHTIYNITVSHKPSVSSPVDGSLKPFASSAADEDNCLMALEAEDPDESPLSVTSGRLPELGAEEAVDSFTPHGENSVDDQRAALKRPRLVWTPHLHKRFVDVVTHLGTKNAVPKTIMQLMNVDGLTRENVASHLQKYRNHLKRIQGFPSEVPSSSDHIFASTTLQQNLHKQQPPPPPPPPPPSSMRMPHSIPTMIPMPIYAIPHHQSHGVVPLNNHQGGTPYHGFFAHDPYATNN